MRCETRGERGESNIGLRETIRGMIGELRSTEYGVMNDEPQTINRDIHCLYI